MDNKLNAYKTGYLMVICREQDSERFKSFAAGARKRAGEFFGRSDIGLAAVRFVYSPEEWAEAADGEPIGAGIMKRGNVVVCADQVYEGGHLDGRSKEGIGNHTAHEIAHLHFGRHALGWFIHRRDYLSQELGSYFRDVPPLSQC